MRVLFLSGADRESDGSRIYRCEYQARQIEQAGGHARVGYIGDVSADELDDTDVLVLSRCHWGAAAVEAIRSARRRGKLVCGDLDDRIYAPWEADGTGAFRTRELAQRHHGVRERAAASQHEILSLLPCFDEVLTSTQGICEELEHLGLRAWLAPNAVDTRARPPRAQSRCALRRILFMTGTRTHDADFQLLRAELLQFVSDHRDVRLTLLGPLTAPPDLLALARVRCVGKLPMAELDAFVAEHDVCLVPLEASPFNDCKSELKFIECGLVCVPVIASPRRAFVQVIRDGENGLLVGERGGWYAALRALHDSPDLLRRVAAAAHHSVLSHHTVASRGTRLADHLRALAGAARPTPALLPSPTRAGT